MQTKKRNFFNKKTSPIYFQHDSNARNDSKILQLRMRYGFEGYGIYWALLESLRTASKYKYKKEFITGLAFDFRIETEKLTEIIEYCFEIGLFKSNNSYFWSNGLSNRMKLMDEKTKKLSEAGARGALQKYNQNHSNPDKTIVQNPADERFNVVNLSDD